VRQETSLGDTRGADDFVRNASLRMNQPLLYLSYRLDHARPETGEQQGSQAFADYVVKDARFQVMRRVKQLMNAKLAKSLEEARDPTTSINVDARLFADAAREAAELVQKADLMSVIDQIASIYRRAAELARIRTDGNAARFANAASRLHSEKDRHVLEVIEGFRDYAYLIERWQALIAAAPTAASEMDEIDVVWPDADKGA